MKNKGNLTSFARKKSTDPKQEHLRQRKQDFNKEMSELISQLIEFKKSINGKGSTKFNVAPTKIQDPLPSDIKSILSRIDSQADKLFQESGGIIDEQSAYSQGRKKPKQAGADMDYFNKNASWWGSRLLSRFQFGDDTRKSRLQLMNDCTEILSLVDSINDDLSPSKEGFVMGAIDNFNEIYNIYISRILVTLKFLKTKHQRGSLEDLPPEISNEFESKEQKGPRQPNVPSGSESAEGPEPSSPAAPAAGAGAAASGAGGKGKAKKEKTPEEQQSEADKKKKEAMFKEIEFIYYDIINALPLVKQFLADLDKKELDKLEKSISLLFDKLNENNFDEIYQEITLKNEEALNIGKKLIKGMDAASFKDIFEFYQKTQSGQSTAQASVSLYEIKKLAQFSLSRGDHYQENNIYSLAAKRNNISIFKEKIKKTIDGILNRLEMRNLNAESLLSKFKNLNDNLLELCNILYEAGALTLERITNDYNHVYQKFQAEKASKSGRYSSGSDYQSELEELKEIKDIMTVQLNHLKKVNAELIAKGRSL